jgi:branched chain amino acid efflux pump
VTQEPSLLRRGVADAIPLGIALLAIGLVLGTLSREAGLSWWLTAAAAGLVYAGSAQFLAMGQLAAGAATGTIVATTFLTSLRYLLFVASLAPHLRDAPRRRLPLLAHGVADGSYALTIERANRYPDEPRLDRYLLGTSLVSFGAWVAGNIAGAVLGAALPADAAFALAFATPAIFIALLAPQLRCRLDWIVAATAGIGVVAGGEILPAGMESLVAIVVAAVVGGLVKWRRDQRFS